MPKLTAYLSKAKQKGNKGKVQVSLVEQPEEVQPVALDPIISPAAEVAAVEEWGDAADDEEAPEGVSVVVTEQQQQQPSLRLISEADVKKVDGRAPRKWNDVALKKAETAKEAAAAAPATEAEGAVKESDAAAAAAATVTAATVIAKEKAEVEELPKAEEAPPSRYVPPAARRAGGKSIFDESTSRTKGGVTTGGGAEFPSLAEAIGKTATPVSVSAKASKKKSKAKTSAEESATVASQAAALAPAPVESKDGSRGEVEPRDQVVMLISEILADVPQLLKTTYPVDKDAINKKYQGRKKRAAVYIEECAI